MAAGDRLVTRRWLAGTLLPYMHHGIDVGDGTVVRARPDDPKRIFGGGRVVRTSLEEFADGSTVGVEDDPPAAFPPKEIVRRAVEHVGREGYSPVVDNCEHFATWCAPGRRGSRQIDRLVAVSTQVLSIAIGIVVSRAGLRIAGRTPRA